MGETFQYPWKRIELIEYIRELADFSYQRQHWMNPEEGKIVGISPIIDFLLIDQALDVDPEGAVGLYILQSEVKTVRDVATGLSNVVRNIRDQYDSEGALNDPFWPQLVLRAKLALSILETRNIP